MSRSRNRGGNPGLIAVQQRLDGMTVQGDSGGGLYIGGALVGVLMGGEREGLLSVH